ncbi:TetR family transcriptional regulator [Actinocatenispora thailandica]|uniref:TetR family transcriptional regulator n=1 Tax=Actinocatenispora thailandica TaxID=227318 RepID=UPI001EF34974|nr:TetR family transcriptional regulator [Actinocatenispora thailandica]
MSQDNPAGTRGDAPPDRHDAAAGPPGIGRPHERRRGRQAEAARNDRLVLDAAREVFASQGFAAPVAAVAARAGVGMGTLYRRYGSKTELLQRLCVLAMTQASAAAEQALAADDPWVALTGYITERVGFRSGALAPLAGTIPVTDEMLAAARHGRRLHSRVVGRAHRAGVLRHDVTAVDIALLIEHFSRRAPDELTGSGDRLLAIAIAGLRPTDEPELPEPAPGWHAYEQRWHG